MLLLLLLMMLMLMLMLMRQTSYEVKLSREELVLEWVTIFKQKPLYRSYYRNRKSVHFRNVLGQWWSATFFSKDSLALSSH